MRTWVEKLAENSKNNGNYCHNIIFIEDMYWDIYRVGEVFHISMTKQKENSSTCIEISEDEYDLLNEALLYCKNKNEDYFIELINNF